MRVRLSGTDKELLGYLALTEHDHVVDLLRARHAAPRRAPAALRVARALCRRVEGGAGGRDPIGGIGGGGGGSTAQQCDGEMGEGAATARWAVHAANQRHHHQQPTPRPQQALRVERCQQTGLDLREGRLSP